MTKRSTNGAAGASVDALWKRIASAAALAPMALGALYLGGAVFASIVAFAVIVMTFEWCRMVTGRDFTVAFLCLALAGAAALALAAAGLYGLAYAATGVGALATGAAARGDGGSPFWAGFGAPYVIGPSIALVWLRTDIENGAALTLLLFLIVWAADSGGYIAGRLVGGPRMSPSISPAKTWAGAAGGLLFGAAAAYGAARWLMPGAAPVAFAGVGAALGLASILGDMAESALKRQFGVKDSSGFIPGHGGALDRLDGMIFATTAMTAVLYADRIGLGAVG